MRWIRENLERAPSFSPFSEHLLVIEQSIEANPSLCIETCKSLVEGICKTILILQRDFEKVCCIW